MDNPGYIKLFRKFLDWEWYDDANCKILFIHILIKANYKDKQWRGKTIQRGQFFTSIDSLAGELRFTPKQLRIAISKLKNTGEITSKGAKEGTYITVCNYDNYQYNEQAEGQDKGEIGARRGQDEGEIGATTNNIKKDNKEKNGKKVRAFAPPTIEEVKDYCKERNNKVNPEKFISHYEANGWMVGKNKMKDWRAAVRTWEQNKEYGTNSGSNKIDPKRTNSYWD